MTETSEINAEVIAEIFRRIDYLYERISNLQQLNSLLSDYVLKDKAHQDIHWELAIERIKNLELSVLPNFAADLERLRKLTRSPALSAKYHPLDFRESTDRGRISPEGPPWRWKKGPQEPASN
jgi:hypothetical protein